MESGQSAAVTPDPRRTARRQLPTTRAAGGPGLHPPPLPILVLSLALATACAARSPRPLPPTALATPTVAVMGNAVLTAPQLAAWFASRPKTAERYRASVPIDTLARYYLEEGAAEGVAGDLAFMQAVVETGWFRFEGLVEPRHNNFAGLGATGAAGAAPAVFPDARLGVRAHVQHLRAYADASAFACASPPLAHPCADPRFHLVAPKGKAPAWNDMGRGNWAAARGYAGTILGLYRSALAHAGK